MNWPISANPVQASPAQSDTTSQKATWQNIHGKPNRNRKSLCECWNYAGVSQERVPVSIEDGAVALDCNTSNDVVHIPRQGELRSPCLTFS
ncbi:hypothetical protein N7457_006461 [Penicillium paradoxum]|uniref:uncharacterized protein n=1 Tax=Penicillium paradoxum TaxID=176176 RepID=UPI002549923E|nr:uncharacterized protein N7457_006461 [Penicillium paradoxum]KAJ5781301.1 hypothetical protein N7457_006461 [Penicillium paradoxum]